jgi:predicted dehydrogenase
MATLAFAGSGRITVVHGLAAQTLELPVTAVASRDPARAAERAAQLDARAATYDDLPAGADLVVVATPPARHATDTIRALDGGAAVLLEKPLCTTLADADAIVSAADRGRGVVYAENLAFAPVVSAAIRLVSTLGPLRHLEVRSLQNRPDWGDFLTPGWGGGTLFDLGVHPIAVALLLAGGDEPTAVTARLDHADDLEVDDHAEVVLHFRSGLAANVISSWRHDDVVWDLEAASDTGVVRAELLPTLSLEHDGEPVELAPARRSPDAPQLEQFGYIGQLTAAVTVASGGRASSVDARFGRHVLDVVCAAYRSAGNGGRPESLPFTGPRDLTPLELWRGVGAGTR